MSEQSGNTLADLMAAHKVSPMPVKMSAEDKRAWCDSSTVFDIHGVDEVKTQDQHFFNVKVINNGETYTMGFSASAARIQMLRDIQSLLTNGPILQCKLVEIGGVAPNIAYGIEPAS